MKTLADVLVRLFEEGQTDEFNRDLLKWSGANFRERFNEAAAPYQAEHFTPDGTFSIIPVVKLAEADRRKKSLGPDVSAFLTSLKDKILTDDIAFEDKVKVIQPCIKLCYETLTEIGHPPVRSDSAINMLERYGLDPADVNWAEEEKEDA